MQSKLSEAQLTELMDRLLHARGLLMKGWTAGTLAEREDGETVHVKSPQAVAWCAVGALQAADIRVTGNALEKLAWRLIEQELPENASYGSTTQGRLISFNDRGKRKDVLDLFDRVLTRVTQERDDVRNAAIQSEGAPVPARVGAAHASECPEPALSGLVSES